MSKLLSSVQGIFSDKLFFENKFLELFLSFWPSGALFWTFGQNFAIGLSKPHSMCPVEIFDWTVFSTKIYEYFHRPRAARKTFWHFGAKTSESLSNLQFRSTKIFCWTFDFWRKNVHNCLEYWSKNFQVFVKKCWVGEKFMSKVIFFVGKNSCLPTEFEGESFWCSVRTFGRFVKTATLCVRMRFLSELFFLWIFWVFSLFSDCGKNILQHWRKKFREVVKGAFYLNNKSFRGKFVFWRKYLLSQFFRYLMKNSAHLCRKAFPPIWKIAFCTRSGYRLA